MMTGSENGNQKWKVMSAQVVEKAARVEMRLRALE